MQKITYIILGAVLLGSMGSCKKYLEDASVNPNNPTSVSPSVMLSAIEVSTFSNYTAANARRIGTFTQHFTGALFQSLDITNYLVLESDVTNDWRGIYSSAIVNASILIEKHGDSNPHYKGIAQVLKAMNLGLATDMWGDVPSKEAVKGLEGNIAPKYDSQQSVYSDIQALLSEAITNLSKGAGENKILPLSDDYIFGGNTQKWIAAAWALKARYANHLSEVSAGSSADDAISYLNSAYAAGFTSPSADLQAKFGTTGLDQNQFEQFNQSRANYLKIGKYFVDLLQANADPRLPFYAAKTSSNTYVGADPASPDQNASNVGSYATSTALPLMSFSEAKFIEAEAAFRKNDKATAAAAYNAAVKASVLQVTGASNPVFEAVHANATAGTITLQMIMMEKYIAMYTQPESWTDWRRTDLPTLTPNSNGVIAGIPRILPTSQEERVNNPNATINSNLLQKMWLEN